MSRGLVARRRCRDVEAWRYTGSGGSLQVLRRGGMEVWSRAADLGTWRHGGMTLRGRAIHVATGGIEVSFCLRSVHGRQLQRQLTVKL